jgi:steroid 5-alpha reductase family enzyme
MHVREVIIITQLAMLAWMGFFYLLQWKTRDAGVVDIGWTAGVGVSVGLFAWFLGDGSARTWLVTGMVALWSARLVLYVISDRVWNGEEDRRYKSLRAYWGDRADRNFFFFFEAQAFLVVMFAVPALVAMINPRIGFNGWDAAGIAVWLVAILGEYVADRQLEVHRANPSNRGVTCRSGLWRYSRHPNYFFEWLHWWAYVLLAVGSPWFWASLIGPAAMLLFVLKLTGIPHTERQALSSRPDYADYQRTTNKFFPWFPRKAGSC